MRSQRDKGWNDCTFSIAPRQSDELKNRQKTDEGIKNDVSGDPIPPVRDSDVRARVAGHAIPPDEIV